MSPRFSSCWGRMGSVVLEEGVQVTSSLSLSHQGRKEAHCLSGKMTSIPVSPGPRPPRDTNLRAETRMCSETGPAGPAWSSRVLRRGGGPSPPPLPVPGCDPAASLRVHLCISGERQTGRVEEHRCTKQKLLS